MIGIKIDGKNKFLNTKPNTSIDLTLENPIFSDDVNLSPGSYSLPFTLPGGEASPDNSELLENPDVVENSRPYQVSKATLYFDGIPFKKGNIYLENINEARDISSHFTFGLSTVNTGLKPMKVRDLFITEVPLVISTSQTKIIWVQRITAGDISLTLNGQQYTFPNTPLGIIDFNAATGTDAFTQTLDKPNAWAPRVILGSGVTPGGISGTYLGVKLVQFFTISPGVTGERDATDPLLELHVTSDDKAAYMVEAEMGSYFADMQDFISPYLNEGTYPNDIIRFPVVFNDDPYEDKTIKHRDWVNMVDSSGLIVNDPNWGLPISRPFEVRNWNSLQPFILVKKILDRIAAFIGFQWEGDFYEDPALPNMLLWNTASLDVPQSFIGDTKFIFWKQSFKVMDLVPEDLTIVQFLKNLQSRYNLSISYNDQTNRVRLRKRETIVLSSEVSDLTRKASPLDDIQNDRMEGLNLIVPKDDSDLLSETESLSIGVASKDEQEVLCGRLFATKTTLIESASVDGPRVAQQFGEKAMMRVFHYGGIVDNGVFSYPSALISNGNFQETLTQLYDSYWKFWINARLRRLTVKLSVLIPFRELRELDFERKFQFDRTNFLMKSIKVDLTNTGISASEVVLYTV